jgi:hypothetical protein
MLWAFFAVVAVGSSPAQADMVVWDFNLPATAVNSQTPPYPSVATLTLQDAMYMGQDAVLFTLDPNESNPGYEAQSEVDALNIAFQGVDLTSDHYVNVSGPEADPLTFSQMNVDYVAIVAPPSNALNLDSSYKSPDAAGNGQLLLKWNTAAADGFNVTQVSQWYIVGTTIAANFSLLATSNSNPSPAFGIFSVAPIDLTDPNPTPSNWVTGPSPVPLPGAVWLFGSAMLGLLGVGYRRKAAA